MTNPSDTAVSFLWLWPGYLEAFLEKVPSSRLFQAHARLLTQVKIKANKNKGL
jgi:hypothetical protein